MIEEGKNFTRVNKEIIDGYKKIAPATVGHYLRTGFCDPEIKPIYNNISLVGSAFTVQLDGEDIGAISRAYELVEEGDILVVSSGSNSIYACAGEVSTFKSLRLGVKGLIVDGSITDCLEMEQMKFPCFSRHINALVGKPKKQKGAVKKPVSIGGVIVNSGDLVLADDNGVMFMDPNEAKEILPDMIKKEQDEDKIREEFWKEWNKIEYKK